MKCLPIFTPNYIIKLGFTGVYIFFLLILIQNIDCWYSLEPYCVLAVDVLNNNKNEIKGLGKGTSRQRSGKGAISKRFPLQKPSWEKTKLTIRYLYHETYCKPNEQLFSQ